MIEVNSYSVTVNCEGVIVFSSPDAKSEVIVVVHLLCRTECCDNQ